MPTLGEACQEVNAKRKIELFMLKILSAANEGHKNASCESVTRLLVVLTGSVFLIETLVMFLLDILPPMSAIVDHLLDATLLSILLFPIFYFLVFRPLMQSIAERRQAEDELRIAAITFETKEPILITDAQANILRANQMFLSISGYSAEELIGKNARILDSGRQDKEFYEQMWKQLLYTGSWSGSFFVKCQGAHVIPLGVMITAVKNRQQEITHFVAIYNFN